MTVIRPAQITELNRLLEIVSAATHHMESQGIHQWDNIYPDGTTLKADNEKQHMQVVEVNGQIAGMISINDEQSPEYGNVQWRYAGKALVVHRLTIDPSQQRRGLAARLMQFAEEIAESKGYDTIRFDAFTQNHGATALYENLGYEKAGTVQFRKGLFFCFEKPVNPLWKK
jgi:ribosomal protein S18 acetylase RimI-like enzyme